MLQWNEIRSSNLETMQECGYLRHMEQIRNVEYQFTFIGTYAALEYLTASTPTYLTKEY